MFYILYSSYQSYVYQNIGSKGMCFQIPAPIGEIIISSMCNTIDQYVMIELRRTYLWFTKYWFQNLGKNEIGLLQIFNCLIHQT